MANRYPLILNASAGQLQELPVGDSLDLGGERIIGVGAGTNGAPSISFTGDADTGIYSPDTNEVAIATGGAGRLFVDESGNIQIKENSNTTSTGASLYLFDTAAAAGGGNSSGRICFYSSDSTDGPSIRSEISNAYENSSADSALLFKTYDGTLAERLRITSDGKVGLGTSSPVSLLDAQGDVSITGNENYLYLYSTYVVGSNARVRIRAVGAGGGSGYGGDFRVSTRASSNTWNTDAFVVNSSGNVGVGTTSPSQKLHVAGSIRTGTTSDFVYANNIGQISSAQALALVSNSDLVVKNTSGTEHARIDNLGRLLVGTSSSIGADAPIQGSSSTSTFQLELFRHSSDATGSYIRLTKARGTQGSPAKVNADDALGAVFFGGYDGAAYRGAATIVAAADAEWGTGGDTTDNPSRLVFSTTADGDFSPTERMRIDSSGNVGVGTTSPGANLEIGTPSGSDTSIKLNSSTSDYLEFSSEGTIGYIIAGHPTTGGGELGFKTKDGGGGSPVERARIDSSGRLLVGTSSALTATDVSKSKFVINGDTDGSGFPARIALNNSVATVLANYKLGELYFSGQAAGNAAASIACLAESAWNTAGDTTDNPGRLVFSTTADGASSPTERMRITSTGQMRLAGAGITFNGDTATANELDDYEEGTWTPTIVTGGWTGFQDILNAKYTKIGKQVTVYLFGNNLQGTGDGAVLVVGGLPFTSATNGYATGSVDFGKSIDAGAYCRVESGSTSVGFYRPSGSVSVSRIAITGNRIGDSYLIFSVTYIVA